MRHILLGDYSALGKAILQLHTLGQLTPLIGQSPSPQAELESTLLYWLEKVLVPPSTLLHQNLAEKL